MNDASRLPLPQWTEYYIGLYRSGVFCDAVLWDGLASKLTIDDALSILDGLNPESKQTLLERWLKQPWSNYPDRGDVEVRQIMIDWCQTNAQA